MAYIDVAAWTPEHVVCWIRGLHKSLEKTNFDGIIEAKVTGAHLLLQTAQDLVDLIPSIRVDALQAILQGINLLHYFNYSSSQETLQSLTLSLACQSRYLYNQMVQAEQSPRLLPVSTTTATPMTGNSKNRFDFAKVDSNMQINQSTKQRVSLETLDIVSIIVNQILYVVEWLNSSRSTSSQPKFSNEFKNIVLRVAVELTSTAQRDQFVEQPNDVLKKTSKFLADYCEWVVLAIDDPDFIQPCWLDVVSVKKKAEETEFGIGIQPATLDSLSIVRVTFSSPAHRSGRMTVGDEIVQVDYQTVIGWPQSTVENLIESYKNDIILTIKKKPNQSSLNPSIIVVKPYPISLKKLLPQNVETLQASQVVEILETEKVQEREEKNPVEQTEEGSNLEPPKKPKGPVYELQPIKYDRRELKRRISISGSISDALVDLSLADSLPIPSLEKAPAGNESSERVKSNRISKETLTKSVSHDTAKLYLHTLSIDRKYLWLSQSTKED